MSAPASSPPIADPARDKGLFQAWPWLLAAITRATLTRPWALVIAAAISFVPAIYLSSKLGLNSSFLDLLSPRDPEVVELDRVLDKTGGLGFSVIAVPAEDRARAERLALALQERIAEVPGVKSVEGRIDVEFVEDRSLYYLDVAEIDALTAAVTEAVDRRVMKEAGMLLLDEDAGEDPLDRVKQEASKKGLRIAPFSVGSDGKYLYVQVVLGGAVSDLGVTSRIQAEVERAASAVAAETAPGAELRFTGHVVRRREDAACLREDLSRAGAVGLAAVALLILGSTRRPSAVVLLSLPLLLGLAWTFAFAYLAVQSLNVVSGFLVSILSGLGIEYGIHLHRRYTEERQGGQSPEEATARVIASTGRALLAACLVNAAVFAVVAVAGFRGFMEFGLIASVGMLLTMAATLLLFPPLNYLFDRRRPAAATSGRLPRPLFVPAPLRYAVVALVILGAAGSLRALAAGRVRFHTDWKALSADTPAERFDSYVSSTRGPSTTRQALLYLEAPGQLPLVREAVAAARAKRAAVHKPFNVTSVTGLEDFIPRDQEAKAAAMTRLQKQLARVKPSRLSEDERAMLDRANRMVKSPPFGVADVPRSLKQRFLTADGVGTLAAVESDAILDESSLIIDWSDQMAELRAQLRARGVRGALASENAVAGRIFRTILESGWRILGATFGVVFLVLYLEFRRVPAALAVLSPVVLGMLLMAGGMALLHLDLNFMNAAILPIAVGVSLDNAMHIWTRFTEEGPSSMPLVLRRTGAAALLSSATNLTGFAALFVARHRGLRSVAELSVLGIAATVFTTTVFFPFVLDALARARFRSGSPSSPPSGTSSS
ncbi:MAG: MMPL family transporter [Minicystis sp.]